MKNCFNCKIVKECDCGKMILELKEYLPNGIYNQIKDIIIMQLDCEYYEE